MEQLDKKKNMIEALEKALENEEKARQYYVNLAAEAQDPDTRALLEQLARWEAGHYQMLSDRITTLKVL